MTPSGTAAALADVDDPPARNTRWAPWAAAAATLLALVLVVYDAGSKSIWYDEGFTLSLVDGSLRHLWDGVYAGDVNQWPYYLVFWVWQDLGHAEGTLRLLSGLCSVATVPLVYLIGRRLHADARVAVGAAVLVAVHAGMVSWGQQLRGYSAAVLATTLATWLFVRAVEQPSTRRSVLYGVAAALAVYCHFFVGLVVVAHALSLLLLRPVPRRLVVVASVVGGVLLVPLAVFLTSVDGDPLEWIPTSTLRGLFERVAEVAGGGSLQLAAYGLACLAGTAWVVSVVRARPRSPEAWRSSVALLWVAVPLVLMVGGTFTAKPILVSRYLVFVIPGLALLAAQGVAYVLPRSRAAAGGLGALLLVASLLGLSSWYRSPSDEDWRTVTAVVLDRLEPGEEVVFAPARARYSFRYYQQEAGVPEVVNLNPEADDPPAGPRLIEMQRGERTDVARRRLPGLQAWLDRWYDLVGEERYDGITVRTYERR